MTSQEGAEGSVKSNSRSLNNSRFAIDEVPQQVASKDIMSCDDLTNIPAVVSQSAFPTFLCFPRLEAALRLVCFFYRFSSPNSLRFSHPLDGRGKGSPVKVAF